MRPIIVFVLTYDRCGANTRVTVHTCEERTVPRARPNHKIRRKRAGGALCNPRPVNDGARLLAEKRGINALALVRLPGRLLAHLRRDGAIRWSRQHVFLRAALPAAGTDSLGLARQRVRGRRGYRGATRPARRRAQRTRHPHSPATTRRWWGPPVFSHGLATSLTAGAYRPDAANRRRA